MATRCSICTIALQFSCSYPEYSFLTPYDFLALPENGPILLSGGHVTSLRFVQIAGALVSSVQFTVNFCSCTPQKLCRFAPPCYDAPFEATSVLSGDRHFVSCHGNIDALAESVGRAEMTAPWKRFAATSTTGAACSARFELSFQRGISVFRLENVVLGGCKHARVLFFRMHARNTRQCTFFF